MRFISKWHQKQHYDNDEDKNNSNKKSAKLKKIHWSMKHKVMIKIVALAQVELKW